VEQTGGPGKYSDLKAFNRHFIGDVGITYITCSIALLFSFWTRNQEARTALLLGGSMFHVGHALWHVYEISTGELSASRWIGDLPGVFLPAIVLVLYVFVPVKTKV
jgi:hypothetical protein